MLYSFGQIAKKPELSEVSLHILLSTTVAFFYESGKIIYGNGVFKLMFPTEA